MVSITCNHVVLPRKRWWMESSGPPSKEAVDGSGSPPSKEAVDGADGPPSKEVVDGGPPLKKAVDATCGLLARIHCCCC